MTPNDPHIFFFSRKKKIIREQWKKKKKKLISQVKFLSFLYFNNQNFSRRKFLQDFFFKLEKKFLYYLCSKASECETQNIWKQERNFIIEERKKLEEIFNFNVHSVIVSSFNLQTLLFQSIHKCIKYVVSFHSNMYQKVYLHLEIQ